MPGISAAPSFLSLSSGLFACGGRMRHNHSADERCPLCADWPRYAIELAILIERTEQAIMTQSDDIQAQTTAIERNTAILTDVKTAVDNLRGQIDPTLIAGLDAAVAGEGSAVQALAADVNVDQAPVETPAPVEPVTTPEAPADGSTTS